MKRNTRTAGHEPMLSIGAVSRATGIPVETLRTWERRYGLDVAQRSPSGHRRYPLSSVAHIRRIAAVLGDGHRASDVMNLTERQLESLLDANRVASSPLAPGIAVGVSAARPPGRSAGPSRVREWIEAITAFDGEALRMGLEAEAVRSKPLVFIDRHLAPLMVAVGRAWQNGRMDVRHEHFAAAHASDLLRDMRRRLEPRGRGPRVAVASPTGDRHEVPILMASVILAGAGWHIVYLGPDTPADQLSALAHDGALEAVAVGVSSTAPQSTRGELVKLAAALPSFTRLVMGGSGAPARVPRALKMADLAALERWAIAEEARLRGGGRLSKGIEARPRG